MISGNGADLQCILPCNNSKQCDCLTNWDVTPMNDMNEVMLQYIASYGHIAVVKYICYQEQMMFHYLLLLLSIQVSIEKDRKCLSEYKNEPMRFSFKFSCSQPDATSKLICCFELHGVDQIGRCSEDQ